MTGYTLRDRSCEAQSREAAVADEHDVEIRRIIEGGRNIRTVAICTVVAIGFVCITVAAISMSQPPWLAFLLALLGPFGLVTALLRLVLRFMKRKGDHAAKLEQQLDPGRSSSVLADLGDSNAGSEASQDASDFRSD